MQSNDIVRVKNVGEERWTDKFNNQRFVIDPGRDAVVPFAAVCLWLGNPDSRNKPGGQQHRRLEYNRLVIRYGGADNPELWERAVPKLEVYDFDNNRIMTVVDDPEGKGVHTSSSTVEEQEILQKKVDELTRSLTAMRQRMEDVGGLEPVSEDIQEDVPTRVPTGSRVSPAD